MMRGKCKGAKAEIDVRLLEAATISVEVRAFRKVADIRIGTTNVLVMWEADIEMLRKLREMLDEAERVLVGASKDGKEAGNENAPVEGGT